MQFVPGNIHNIEGPGWGPQEHVQAMRQRELAAFCHAHGLMGQAIAAYREHCPGLEFDTQYNTPPAVILRDVIRSAGLKGTEPAPQQRAPETPPSVRTEYENWAFPALRKECTQRGISYWKTMKKTDLVALLQRHDTGEPEQEEVDFTWPAKKS